MIYLIISAKTGAFHSAWKDVELAKEERDALEYLVGSPYHVIAYNLADRSQEHVYSD